jgi:hypothetical protein
MHSYMYAAVLQHQLYLFIELLYMLWFIVYCVMYADNQLTTQVTSHWVSQTITIYM